MFAFWNGITTSDSAIKRLKLAKLSILEVDFMTVLGVAGGEDIGYNWKYKRSFGNVYC